MWKQRHLKAKPTKYWEDAVLMYLERTALKENTRKKLTSLLKWVDQYLRRRSLLSITKQVIEEMAIAKEQTGCGPITVNIMLRKVKTILRRACYDWEWIDKVPTIRLRKEPASRVRWEAPETLAQVIALCPAHKRDAILLSLSTGLRKGHVAAMQKSWIDKEHGVITIPAHLYKNGKPHTSPLNELAMQIIERNWNNHEIYLFVYQGKPMKELNTKAWRDALKKAGITDFRWHDMRHTWASWMAQNGEQLLTIMESGGWSDYRSVKRYAHLAIDNLKQAADRLAGTKLSRLEKDSVTFLARLEKKGENENG